jgi:hypothetical protein
MPRTIFITSFFGLIGRNILATDTLKTLRARRDLRIVILASENKKEQYQKQFGGENAEPEGGAPHRAAGGSSGARVLVEGVRISKPSKLEQFFAVLFHHLSDTAAWRIHRLIYRKRTGNYLMFAMYWLISKAGYLKPVRMLARWAENNFLPKNKYREYFEKYKPDMLFATDVFQENDLDVMREAKARRIFTIGMVRSWDNITTKGLNRIIPDRLVVNTEKIEEEAIKYNDIKPEKIDIVGIPHYDAYVRDRRASKEEVFKKLGLDPNKKTIFFAPPSDIYAEGDPITEKIVNALSPLDAQLLLRLYIVGQVNLGDIRPVPARIAIDVPASGSDFAKADLTTGDSHLADLLYHSDVVVAFASTLAIDAVVFGKPVVFIGFDGDNRPYWKSLSRFYDYDHQKSILKTGGVRLAKNPEKLVQYVKDYLANLKLDESGRNKIIEERCWKLDGKSGERLASVILRQIQVL